MIAKEIDDSLIGCHVQFRHKEEDGPHIIHGVLDSYSVGLVAVLLSLKYTTGEVEQFVVDLNEGVTFIVQNSE